MLGDSLSIRNYLTVCLYYTIINLKILRFFSFYSQLYIKYSLSLFLNIKYYKNCTLIQKNIINISILEEELYNTDLKLRL